MRVLLNIFPTLSISTGDHHVFDPRGKKKGGMYILLPLREKVFYTNTKRFKVFAAVLYDSAERDDVL